MTLLDTIKSNAATTRAEAVVIYRQLLARNDRPKPGDEREMAEVMRTLGLSAEDVADDCRALEGRNARQQNVDVQQRLEQLVAAHPRAFAERPSRSQSAGQVHYGGGPTPPTFAPGHPGNVRTVDASTGVARSVARRSR